MSIYAMINLAGSTGKTATVIALACELAKRGLRVRLIDFDKQANTSSVFGYPYFQGQTILNVMYEKATIAEVELPGRVLVGFSRETGEDIYRDLENVTIVPTFREALDPLDTELTVAGAVNRLRRALVADIDQRPEEQPDVTLIDCGGTGTKAHEAAVLATTAEGEGQPGEWGVITCAKPAGKELEGVPDLQKKLKLWEDTYNRKFPLLCIFPTLVPVQGGVVSKAESDEGRQFDFRIGSGYRAMLNEMIDVYDGELLGGITPPIRFTRQVDHAYTARVPLLYYKPNDTRDVAADYSSATDHLLARGLFSARVAAA